MRYIHVLDRDSVYAARLASRLEQQLEGYRVLCDAEPGIEPCLVLAGCGYNQWTPASGDLPVIRLVSGFPEPENTSSILNRLGDTTRIVKVVREALKESSPGGTPQTRMIAVLSDLCDPERKSAVQRLLEPGMTAGARTVYLPLLPAYRISCTAMGGTDQAGITQLLLRIRQEDLDPKAIGGYAHPARDSTLCFAPVENFDDLLGCEPDLLRRLMTAIRQWHTRSNPGSILVADLGDLPETVTATALSLCDEVQLLCQAAQRPAGGYSARVAPLLARTPTRCRIMKSRIRPFCMKEKTQ